MRKLDEYSRSDLHYVCVDIPKNDRVEATKKLLASGLDVNHQDINGWSSLHFAAQEGDAVVAQVLIDTGANIGLRDINGNNVLWVATMNSQKESDIIHVLLLNGADPAEKNDHDVSPIDIEPDFFNQ